MHTHTYIYTLHYENKNAFENEAIKEEKRVREGASKKGARRKLLYRKQKWKLGKEESDRNSYNDDDKYGTAAIYECVYRRMLLCTQKQPNITYAHTSTTFYGNFFQLNVHSFITEGRVENILNCCHFSLSFSLSLSFLLFLCIYL